MFNVSPQVHHTNKPYETGEVYKWVSCQTFELDSSMNDHAFVYHSMQPAEQTIAMQVETM